MRGSFIVALTSVLHAMIPVIFISAGEFLRQNEIIIGIAGIAFGFLCFYVVTENSPP